MVHRLLLSAAVRALILVVSSVASVRSEDTSKPAALYWTFPVDHTFLELGGPYDNDPFSSEQSPAPKQPPKPVTWQARPDFFLVGTIYDAMPILREAGIALREGEDLAFFHKHDQCLYVRCSRESADLIDQFTSSMGPGGRTRNLEVDFLLIGLNDPAIYRSLEESEDPRAMAEEFATDAAKILARASILTRSGQRAAIGQAASEDVWPADQVPADKPSEARPLPAVPAAPGLRLEVEPTLGADGNTMDLSVNCNFVLLAQPEGEPLITGRLSTMVTMQSGRTFFQRLSLEGAPWREVAVLLTTTVKGMDLVGWKDGVRLGSPREQRWRALGEPPGQRELPARNH
jgi:hypothetical protein